MKPSQEIERDFFTFIKESELGEAIGGSVYRSAMRPYNAKTEDIVVKFLAGEDEQIQTGIVIVNVYVPNIYYRTAGQAVPNHARLLELQDLVNQFFEDFASTEYWIYPDTTPIVLEDDDIAQHHIYVRIRFKRMT